MASLKQLLYAEANGLCCYCGRKTYLVPRRDQPDDLMATREHIIPVSLGGTTEWFNLALACMGCNSRRGNGPAPPAPYLPNPRTPPLPGYRSCSFPRPRRQPFEMWQPAVVAPCVPRTTSTELSLDIRSHADIQRELLHGRPDPQWGARLRIETIRMLHRSQRKG